MSRPTTTFLNDFLAADSGETQSFVVITFKNGTVRRFATANLTVDSQTYTDDLIEAGEIEEAVESQTDKVDLILNNVDKQIGLDISAKHYHFADASLRRLFRKADGTSEWTELFWGKTLPLSVNESEAKIEIVDALVAAGMIVNWTLAPICHLTFKSTECGYSGSETVCNKQLRGDCTKNGLTHRLVGEFYPFVQNQITPPSEPPIVPNDPDGGWNGYGGYGKDGFYNTY